MRRALVLLALAGCSPPAAKPEPPPPAWVYAPPAVTFVPAPIARIGRSQAPQIASVRGIEGSVKVPLRSATPMAVPGDPARAVLYGLEGVRSAIELVDVDAGRVLWRDVTACAAPVVGVTADAIVCADANGVRGIGLGDGKAKWKIAAAYLAMSEDRVVIEGPGEAVIVDAASGDELSRVKLPASIMADAVLASCGDAGRELFAQGIDGKLVRIADAKGGAAVTWGVPVGKIDEIDACEGNVVLVSVRDRGVEGGTLIAIDRASGKVTGRLERVRGHWTARDDSGQLEVATVRGLATVPRDLAGAPSVTSSLVLGELIDARGELRLVRATSASAVVLDRDGVRAYVPFAAQSGVLGDKAIVRASWGGDDLPRRIAMPERYRKTLRLPAERGGVAVPAELRDLPEPSPPATTIEQAGSGAFGVLDVAIDPNESAVVYTLHLEKSNEETNSAGIAAFDLAKRAVRWQRADACDVGEALRIAVARDVVVCASRTRTTPTALVRATSRDGAPRWEHELDHVTDIAAAGDAVLVFDGDMLTVLDAEHGKPRWRTASSDGARVAAAAVVVGASTFVVVVERGHVVARTLRGWPLWSIAIDGTARSMQASGEGVLVGLEDGDAYRIELPTGTVHALPGLNLTYHGTPDLVVAHTAGGPVPGPPLPPPPEPLRVLRPILKPPPDDDPEWPRLWTPLPMPAPLGDSVQVTLFEQTGGLRARNDYGLLGAAVADERGPAGSPVVVYGSGEVLAVDPRTGDPLRRVTLPEDAPVGLVFGTIVEGTPVAGAVLQSPLRVVIF